MKMQLGLSHHASGVLPGQPASAGAAAIKAGNRPQLKPLRSCGSASFAPVRAPGCQQLVAALAAAVPASDAAPSAPSAPASSQPGAGASAFLNLGVDPLLMAGLVQQGMTSPSPIQAAAIPVVLTGINTAIQSYTGSGKTLSYLLPALTLALKRGEAVAKSAAAKEVPVQVVVVAPSQELAMQIVRVAQSMLPGPARTMVQQCIGGANPKYQLDGLARNKPIVVVGTPGRLAEFMRSGALKLHRTPLLVLDEADQLLSPQFAEDMAHITQHTGKRLGPGPAKRTPAASGPDSEPDASASSAKSPVSQTEPSDSTSDSSGKPASSSSSLSAAAAATEQGESATSPSSSSPPLPERRQTVLVSATLSETVLAKTAAWCPSPQYVHAGGPAPTLVTAPAGGQGGQQGQGAAAAAAPEWGWGVKGWDGPASDLGPRTTGSAGGVEGSEGLVPTMPPQLKHYFMIADPQRKVDALRRLIHALGVKRSLVFMNWQQRLKDVQFKLEARSMQVAVLHGEMPKVARQSVLARFRSGKLRALVVSDVVARGLDVADCDAVFHLELPSSAAHYAHRAGRTGRMGAPGTVVSLVPQSEAWVVHKLADKLGVAMQEVHIAFGELRMGPAPADLKDEDADAPSPSASAPSPTQQDARQASASSEAAWSGAQGKPGSASTSTSTTSGAPGTTGTLPKSAKPPGAVPIAAGAAAASGSKSAAGPLSSSGSVPAGSKASSQSQSQSAKDDSRRLSAAAAQSLGAGKSKIKAIADKEGKYEAIVIDDDDEIELEDDDADDDLEEVGTSTRSRGTSSTSRGRGSSSGRGGSSGANSGRGEGSRAGKSGTPSKTVPLSEVNAMLGSSSSFSDLAPLLDLTSSAQSGSSSSSSSSRKRGEGAEVKGTSRSGKSAAFDQEDHDSYDDDFEEEEERQQSSRRGGKKQQPGSTVPLFVTKALAKLEQLEKGGAKGGAGKGGSSGLKGQVQVSKGKGLSSSALSELQRELQELKAEKGKLRDARVQARQQKQPPGK